MHVLQYTKDNLFPLTTNLIPDIRPHLRWAAPAAVVAVLALSGVLANHVSPRDETDWLSRLAENGDAGAQLELGLAYRTGRYGLGVDPRTGLYWLQRSAQAGNAYAADLVGTAYAQGRGTAVDTERARHWWQVAADAGNPDAKRRLGEPTTDPLHRVADVVTGQVVRDQSGPALRQRAQAGDPLAEYQLALRYRDGAWGGVEPDPALARQWLERAAADGNPIARKSLAAARASGQPPVDQPTE